MEVWLDGADLELIKRGNQLGVLHGVTTNPSIIAKSRRSLEETLVDISKHHRGPTAAQVVANRAEEIVDQAEMLYDRFEQIVVKIPVTQEGLKGMHRLSHLQLPMMATSIFTPFQALLACHAKASFLAPYYSQIQHTGMKPNAAVDLMLRTIKTYAFDARIVAASIDSLTQVTACLEIGVHAVTLKPPLFHELITDHPLTLKSIEIAHQKSDARLSKKFPS